MLLGILLAAVVAAPASAAPGCPWMNSKLSANQRAHELVSAMTIDQKIAMLSQAQPVYAHYGAAGFVLGQPSLCIPDLVLNDAGQGVGDGQTNTTAFPAPHQGQADPRLPFAGHWSDAAHRWKVSSGCYRLLVGDPSRNLPLSATIAVAGARCKGARVHVTNATLRRAARGEST